MDAFTPKYRTMVGELKNKLVQLQRLWIQKHGSIQGFSETLEAKAIATNLKSLDEQKSEFMLEEKQLDQEFTQAQNVIKREYGFLYMEPFRQYCEKIGLTAKLTKHNSTKPVLVQVQEV